MMMVEDSGINQQLFHELKSTFPMVPDNVVTTYMQQVQNDRDKCYRYFTKENSKYKYLSMNIDESYTGDKKFTTTIKTSVTVPTTQTSSMYHVTSSATPVKVTKASVAQVMEVTTPRDLNAFVMHARPNNDIPNIRCNNVHVVNALTKSSADPVVQSETDICERVNAETTLDRRGHLTHSASDDLSKFTHTTPTIILNAPHQQINRHSSEATFYIDNDLTPSTPAHQPRRSSSPLPNVAGVPIPVHHQGFHGSKSAGAISNTPQYSTSYTTIAMHKMQRAQAAFRSPPSVHAPIYVQLNTGGPGAGLEAPQYNADGMLMVSPRVPTVASPPLDAAYYNSTAQYTPVVYTPSRALSPNPHAKLGASVASLEFSPAVPINEPLRHGAASQPFPPSVQQPGFSQSPPRFQSYNPNLAHYNYDPSQYPQHGYNQAPSYNSQSYYNHNYSTGYQPALHYPQMSPGYPPTPHRSTPTHGSNKTSPQFAPSNPPSVVYRPQFYPSPPTATTPLDTQMDIINHKLDRLNTPSSNNSPRSKNTSPSYSSGIQLMYGANGVSISEVTNQDQHEMGIRRSTSALDDPAYVDALLQHQHARLDQITNNLQEEVKRLARLQEDVSQMERNMFEKQSTRSRSNSSTHINVEGLAQLREHNRKLLSDIHVISRQMEQHPNNNVLRDQNFYQNMNTGQSGSLWSQQKAPAVKVPPRRPIFPPFHTTPTTTPIQVSSPHTPGSPAPRLPSSTPPFTPVARTTVSHTLTPTPPRYSGSISPGPPLPRRRPLPPVPPSPHPSPFPIIHTPPPPPPQPASSSGDSEEGEQWPCSACTYLNHPALNKCEVCEMPRQTIGCL